MLQITKSNHIPVQLETPILGISTYLLYKNIHLKSIKKPIPNYMLVLFKIIIRS